MLLSDLVYSYPFFWASAQKECPPPMAVGGGPGMGVRRGPWCMTPFGSLDPIPFLVLGRTVARDGGRSREPASKEDYTMNEATPYIGVDVSKDKLDYSVSGEKAVGTCPNTAKGIRKIIGAARERNARVCCEATGGYERALLEACWAGGVEVVLTDPWRVRHFAKGKGVLEKTDAIDARIIARFACENDLRPWARPSEARHRLCDLTRAKETLDKQIQMARGQLEHCSDKAMEKLWRKNIRMLEGMRAKVDQERIAAVNGDERMRHLFERYQLVKGVGPETALSMIAEMPELGTVSDKVAGKLLGAAPIPDDSGKKTGRRLIRRGRFAARRALYMAAVSSIRFNPILRAFYLRLAKSNGKPPKVALVAVMRKLICLLNRIAGDEAFKPSASGSKPVPRASGRG